MRPKNVILLEIIILVTNFNDADLFYYLLLDAFAGMVHHGGRGMAPAAVILPTRAIVPQSQGMNRHQEGSSSVASGGGEDVEKAD